MYSPKLIVLARNLLSIHLAKMQRMWIAGCSCCLLLSICFGGANPSKNAFIALELLFSPVSLLGTFAVGCSVLSHSSTGMSLTALAPLINRYLLHELKLRDDVGAKSISEYLIPPVLLAVSTGPTVLASKLSCIERHDLAAILGYPSLSESPWIGASLAVRTHFIDKRLNMHLSSVDQVVVLGAGFDTKIYRLPASPAVKYFEVDTNRTQPIKRKVLSTAPLDTAHVNYVEVDFNVDSWLDKLLAAGFDKSKRTFFIWEGVTAYLPKDVVDGVLQTMTTCGAASIVVFDVMSSKIAYGEGLFWKLVQKCVSMVKEPFMFGVDMQSQARQHAEEWLRSAGGWVVLDYQWAIHGDYAMVAAQSP